MSNQTSHLALTELHRRHAAILDLSNADPWLDAYELARHRVEALKRLSVECGPSVRQSVSAALSALSRAGSERQLTQSKPRRPAKGRASSIGS